jgi:uncharacterized protein YndB with AHSA1/START domain
MTMLAEWQSALVRRGASFAACAMLAGTIAGNALAQSTPPLPPGVENLSFVAPDGTRTLDLRAVIPAAPAAVWDAWATTDGFRSWAAPVAAVDFRLGGTMEASYDFAAKPGDRDNIRNQIVAFVPGRMFAIRNVQAPAKAPFDVDAFQSLHTVVLLEPGGTTATRVEVVMPGVGTGPAYDSVYKHFEWGNAYVLDSLRKRFAEGPTDWAKVEAQMKAKREAATK